MEIHLVSLDTSSPATRTIDYVATDAARLTSTTTRTVIVTRPDAKLRPAFASGDRFASPRAELAFDLNQATT